MGAEVYDDGTEPTPDALAAHQQGRIWANSNTATQNGADKRYWADNKFITYVTWVIAGVLLGGIIFVAFAGPSFFQ